MLASSPPPPARHSSSAVCFAAELGITVDDLLERTRGGSEWCSGERYDKSRHGNFGPWFRRESASIGTAAERVLKMCNAFGFALPECSNDPHNDPYEPLDPAQAVYNIFIEHGASNLADTLAALSRVPRSWRWRRCHVTAFGHHMAKVRECVNDPVTYITDRLTLPVLRELQRTRTVEQVERILNAHIPVPTHVSHAAEAA